MHRTSNHLSLSHAGSKGIILVIVLVLAGSSVVRAQQTGTFAEERDRGIKLVDQGTFAEAVKVLRAVTKKNKNDITAWHWLGIAFERQGKMGDARKAHEKAAKLGDALLTNQFELGPLEDFGAAIERQMPEVTLASLSADSYLKLSPKLSQKKSIEWGERAEFLRDYRELSKPDGLTFYKSREVTTRARVLSKPEPQYTEEARKHQVSGTVVLRVIFAEDSRVRGIIVLKRLPYGLTAQAVRAARQVRFVPAMKDGRPVSMWMQLEYNFNIY
jgi:TonB family protein